MISRSVVDSSRLEDLLISNTLMDETDVRVGQRYLAKEALAMFTMAGMFGLMSGSIVSLTFAREDPLIIPAIVGGGGSGLLGLAGLVAGPFFANQAIRFGPEARQYLADVESRGYTDALKRGALDLYWVEVTQNIAVGEHNFTKRFGKKIHLLGSDGDVDLESISDGQIVACGISSYALNTDSPYQGSVIEFGRYRRQEIPSDAVHVKTEFGVFETVTKKPIRSMADPEHDVFYDAILIGKRKGYMTRENGSWVPEHDARFEIIGYFPLKEESSVMYVG